MDAIKEFLSDVNSESKILIKELNKLEELEKERKVASAGIVQVNLETQAKVIDKILERYEFFQNDVDINGQRVKIIVNQFLKKAEKAGLKDLVNNKKQKPRWQGKW
jgi:hypothetical protein